MAILIKKDKEVSADDKVIPSDTKACKYCFKEIYALPLHTPIDKRRELKDNAPRRNRKTPRFPFHCSETSRLQTFTGWPHSTPTRNSLALAGFIYTGRQDLVRCFCCDVGLKDFSEGVDPMKWHIIHSHNCDFLIEVYGEVILGNIREAIMQPQVGAVRPNQNKDLTTERVPSLRPHYASYDARLVTFNKWPKHLSQRPHTLAVAGFYYIGNGLTDAVQCFACGKSLEQWEAGDDSWEEHCRWSPDCPFARRTKGDQYIALVQTLFAKENEGQSSEDIQISNKTQSSSFDEHWHTCIIEFGLPSVEFKEAVRQLRKSGNMSPSLEDLIIGIEKVQMQLERLSNCNKRHSL
ncbi:baculoviral IAP repeat-containing protein 3-like [Mya arenaria]|uniref:baculoviral IAP repeat-containing protein 3-like n=1 Tax=Mya arenaria TaxID=6604 RepID=UPI0022E02054|nr:baculoviral IAP repeat-containing protein 3-like [Mya arenaria]XP_052808884.1 baculoviral IAP repeat-containing protein 3-like [Mya arenaria]